VRGRGTKTDGARKGYSPLLRMEHRGELAPPALHAFRRVGPKRWFVLPWHPGGLVREECTVKGTNALGNPMITRHRQKSLAWSSSPATDRNDRIFGLDATQTTTLGTVTCEISGGNTLDSAP
jgi:hypothetical protein